MIQKVQRKFEEDKEEEKFDMKLPYSSPLFKHK